MPSQFFRLLSTFVICLAAAALCGEPEKYSPDPEIEKLIEQTASRDKAAAQAAVEKLAAQGNTATKALNWHLFKEGSPAACVRWAELIAKCGRSRVGYRVAMELQPDGSGSMTLSSDRALLADCGKRFARINGQPEPQFSEEDLKHNPYGKAELLKHLSESVKFQEARVETHGEAIEAMGMLSFKNFDAFTQFADSFDADGYNMIAGTTLTDSSGGTRTFQYRTQPEEDRKQLEKNLLLFHNISWEYVIDFKGKVTRSNATRTDGSKLIWNFNCYQMLTGQAVVQVSYDAAGLSPRPAAKDNALPIPPVASATAPTAVATQPVIHACVCKKTPDGPNKKEILKEHNQLVELDGSASTPRNASLQYQWTQTFGADLNLNQQALAKPNVFLVIKEAGEYRFELVVSVNNTFSKPAEVKVFVEDDEKPATVAVAEPPVKKPEPEVKKPEPEIKKPEPAKPPEPAPAKPPEKAVVKTTEPPPVAPAVENKTPVAYDPAKAKDLFANGQKLMKQFKYAEAKNVLSDAYAADPNNKDCAFELGVALLECNEIVAATTKFEEVLQATKSARAAMYIGHCNARAKNLQEAGRWYKRGASIGKGAVEWESLWQLANSALREKDYKYALGLLVDADKSAAANNVKDYRLPRDLAATYQGLERWDEALTALNELVAMGYTPDPKNMEDVKQKAGKTPAVASAETAKKPPEPTPEPKKEEPKKEPVKVAEVKPEPVKPPETAKPPEPVKPPQPKPEKIDKNAPAVTVDLAALEEKKNAEASKPPVETVKPPEKVVETKKPEPVEVKKPEPAPEPAKPLVVAPPIQTQPKPVKKTPVKIVKKAPPPVPEDFDAALAAGKKACDEGGKLAGQNTDDAKQKMAELLDEAEAMLQGAWAKRPGDETVMAAFKELSKHMRVIAIPRNPVIKVKPRALVVLDAGLSIVPGSTFYCVWEQIGGEDLGIRPEEMAKKVVGLPRSMKPGTYTFELAVSDGTRGGNPVKVTVEVTE
jgi:tetratricopeptide (TPR) repeat protein